MEQGDAFRQFPEVIDRIDGVDNPKKSLQRRRADPWAGEATVLVSR